MKNHEYIEVNEEASNHCRQNYGKNCNSSCKLKALCKEYIVNYNSIKRDSITEKINELALSWTNKTTKKKADITVSKSKPAKAIQRTSDTLF